MKMNKVICCLLFSMIVAGCTTPLATPEEFSTADRRKLLQLSIGMTTQDIMDMESEPAQWTNPIIASLREPDALQVANKTFHVVYYRTDLIYGDGLPNHYELTPIVFQDDKLIGWGEKFLQDVALGRHDQSPQLSFAPPTIEQDDDLAAPTQAQILPKCN